MIDSTAEAPALDSREMRIATYLAAADGFRRSWVALPDESLTFRPPADDYALGGLALHVADTLDGYAALLVRLRDAAEPQEPIDAPGHPERDGWWRRTLHDGPDAGEREVSLERLAAAETAFADALLAIPAGAFDAARDVRYEAGGAPLPTSPADILGWVRDHATDHTRQVSELFIAWQGEARDLAVREIVERFGEAWGRHDLEGTLALVADDCVFEDTEPAPDGTRHAGKAAVRAAWQPLFDDPDARFEAEETFIAGDRCVQRWRYTWATGHVRGTDLFRVRDGLIVEKLSYVKG